MARKNKSKGGGNPNRPRFWGKHAVAAALDNPDRTVLKAWATREAAAFMNFPKEVPVVMAEAPDLGRFRFADAGPGCVLVPALAAQAKSANLVAQRDGRASGT